MDTLVTPLPANPVECARAFLEAILWGAHTTVWELLSEEGRDTVLTVAASRGLDRVTASRIRDDQSDPADHDEFLRELTQGLRRDLRSVDLARVTPSAETNARSDDTVVVDLVTPSEIPGTENWPAGEVVVGLDPDGHWRVHRLEPRIVP